MPTTNRRTKRQRFEQPPEEEIVEELEVAKAKRGVLRSLRFWGVTLALLIMVLWLAPTVVAHTPLLNQILASTLAELPGSLTARSASLGWFSPVVLSDVQLRDEQDELLARAESVEGEVALWRLLMNQHAPGRFRLLRPELRLTVAADESNLERLLKTLEDRPGMSSCPAIEIELIDGVLAIEDTVTERHWQIEDLDALITLARDWSQPMQAKVTAKLPQPNRNAGFNAELTLERSLDKMERASHTGELKLKCDGFPLVVVEPLLRRRWRHLELDGWLTSDSRLTWQAGETGIEQLAVDGELGAEQLRLSGPLTGRDELRLESLKTPFRAQFDGEELTIESLSLDCDIGQAQLTGPVKLAIDPESPAGAWRGLASETFEMSGNVDLAKLAALLPETIRIREGTTITAGRLSWQLSSQLKQGLARWQGRLESSNLEGQSLERRWTWQKPMHVTFAAHNAEQGLVVDKLECQSNFLQAEAAGRLDALSGWATFDLNLLAAELGQFLDLKQVQLAGDGWTHIDWKRQKDGRFQADGEFQVREFRLATPGRRPWSEEHLLMFFSLVGQADKQCLKLVEKANLKLQSKPDELVMDLRRPIDNFTSTGAWPVQLKAKGELATWLARLEPWLGDLPGWDLEGAAEIEGTAEASLDRLVIEDARCVCKPLKIASPRLRVNEPRAELHLKGQFDRESQQATLEVLELDSSGLSIDARSVNIVWAGGQTWRSSGAAKFSGELARWQQWTADPAQPSLWQWSGVVEGDVKLEGVNEPGGGLSMQLDTRIEDLTATCPQREPWREPNLQLTGAVRYLREKESLLIDRLKATSQTVNLEASGQIADLPGRRDLTLNGEFDYEPQQLLDLLKPYLGDRIEITAAREARPFSLQGPLAALAAGSAATSDQAPAELIDTLYRQFTADATTGWVGANVYGFRVDSGEVRGRLADGLLNIDPLNLSVSQGRLTCTPRIRLWPEPAELQVDSGPLLSKVRISPEMCESGLQYIAPVLAGVTQAQGNFSMALDGCRIPLDHPDRGELAGQFTVHTVEIGPGPLVRELATLLDRPGIAKLSKESVVPFKMVDGRVYHRDLELVFPELTIRTHGSVGLDRTLAILAEMPVPPKWIGGNSLGTALKNQTIRLPIGGTLDQPRIDPKALAQASAEFLKTGARNLLFDGLNRGLDRFLKPQE